MSLERYLDFIRASAENPTDSSIIIGFTMTTAPGRMSCSVTVWGSLDFAMLCATSNIVRFIHYGHFYSAPSKPLLLRGAPDYSTDTVSEFHAEAHRQL